MANVKITDLTAYTDPLNTDVLAIVDVTNNVTKKVSIANMAKNVSLGTAALPGVAFDGDPNTGIYSPGADQLAISTNGTGRITVDASGNVNIDSNTLYVDAVNNRVGIGTTSNRNSTKLDVLGDITFGENANYYGTLGYNAGTGHAEYTSSDGGFKWIRRSGSATSMVLDHSGRLLVGTSTARTSGLGSGISLLVEGAPDTINIGTVRNSNNASSAKFVLAKTRGSAVGSNTAVQSGDSLGVLEFDGADGTQLLCGASIEVAVDGTPGANDMPGRLVFFTTADGGSSPTERMRITQAGTILFGKTANDQVSAGVQLIAGGRGSFATNGTECIYVNRNTDDGNLVELAQGGTIEGTISVSGTTVSYNGAHLSRWSQLPSGAERTEIMRGTVLSNIDEMCEWGDEENEQLNRMKVSDVEGDKNVSGVFQAWDDDDDTYTDDFYCAMTGDFIIRIAESVTVERGDLLMSAGDGTAKPQDDDIIRSKTVAKVTSTNVSCTYEDGSYCVPCVLMAC